jgi:hypothetical protein
MTKIRFQAIQYSKENIEEMIEFIRGLVFEFKQVDNQMQFIIYPFVDTTPVVLNEGEWVYTTGNNKFGVCGKDELESVITNIERGKFI